MRDDGRPEDPWWITLGGLLMVLVGVVAAVWAVIHFGVFALI